jgi:hypothetical protein
MTILTSNLTYADWLLILILFALNSWWIIRNLEGKRK